MQGRLGANHSQPLSAISAAASPPLPIIIQPFGSTTQLPDLLLNPANAHSDEEGPAGTPAPIFATHDRSSRCAVVPAVLIARIVGIQLHVGPFRTWRSLSGEMLR